MIKALEKDPGIKLMGPTSLFAEIEVTIMRGRSKCTMAILVQDEAPQDSLL